MTHYRITVVGSSNVVVASKKDMPKVARDRFGIPVKVTAINMAKCHHPAQMVAPEFQNNGLVFRMQVDG